MRKYCFFIAVAASGISVACNKGIEQSETQEPEVLKVTYINAKGGENSKASIDGTTAAFTWNTGDQIAVYADGYKISDEMSSTYDGTNAATFSFSGGEAVDEGDRANFAIFPAALVYDALNNRYTSDVTSLSLKINLPASYTLSEVQDDKAPTPMIAENVSDGDLAFKSICALLRVTIDNVPKQTRAITFDFNGKKVQGEFTLTSVAPGTTGVETSATDGTDDIITVFTPDISSFTSGLVINLPLPAGVASTGEYTDVTITTWDAASSGHKINAITTAVKSGANWVPGRKSSRKLAATLPVFSVSKTGKKAVFAPGNLQAVIGTAPDGNGVAIASSWGFATSQYSFVGNVTGNKTLTAGSTVDLFCWVGASATYDSYGLMLQKSNSDSAHGNAAESLKTDWGALAIGTYSAGYWRTPANSDWRWLLGDQTDYAPGTSEFDSAVKVGTNCRTSSTVNSVTNARFAKAKVADVWGLIIFPDN